MSFSFENLVVKRIAVHHVMKREGKTPGKCIVSDKVLTLRGEELDAFKTRITDALGNPARCIEVVIAQKGEGSLFKLATVGIDADNDAFLDATAEIAKKLAIAQFSESIPGGAAFCWSGTVGYPAKAMFGIIKAEPHTGFQHEDDELKFLTNLLLTDKSRMYKIGVFIDGDDPTEDDDWRAFVYDDHLADANKQRAATYFYEGFLGCGLPEDAAHRTQQFYDYTKKFIAGLEIPEEVKIDLNSGLYDYLKVQKAPTIDVQSFANLYFSEPKLVTAYKNHMEEKKFPLTQIMKDLSNVSSSLKRRKFTFDSDIQLSVPADRVGSDVKISSTRRDGQNGPEIWTNIQVRGKVRSER